MMKLLSLRLENIGGFRTTVFSLDRDALLIGENNSGKTSLLRIVDWILNRLDRDLLEDGRELTGDEQQLLLPARETRNRARRIFLRVGGIDGRSSRKFGAHSGEAEVRVQFRAGNNFARLGAPTRGEDPSSERNAIELIERLQSDYSCLYIPAARDGRSDLFQGVMSTALRQQLTKGMVYDGNGRPAGVPKQVQDAASKLSRNANDLSMSMWAEVKELLQGGFSPQGNFVADLNSSDLVELAIGKVTAKFSMGEHDANAVDVQFLGAGLQSTLSMALAQLSMAGRPNPLFLLEEPEAFLHPSAQRNIAQQLLNRPGSQTIATTHSSAILAEVDASSVVVLRGHSAFPAIPVSMLQESKDRYFLSSWVSEVMFDRSLLLVEGPGDVAFLESLRRRMYGFVGPEILNRMRVCAVGSKDAFGPWLRLLRRYQNVSSGEQAFNVLVCADSIDAGASVVRALRESSIVVPLAVSSALTSIHAGSDPKNPTSAQAAAVATRTIAINEAAATNGVPVHFSSVDLEYSMLEGLSDVRSLAFATEMGFTSRNRNELMSEMGSKGGHGKSSKKTGAKAPFVRAALGDWLEWGELSPNVKELLWRWVIGTLEPADSISRPDELR